MRGQLRSPPEVPSLQWAEGSAPKATDDRKHSKTLQQAELGRATGIGEEEEGG